MKRIFHPVGQGGFFSEHFSGAQPVTIVYDCGALPFNKKFLETKVHSSFKKDEIIDILFISHFHADHTNGVQFLKKHCRIKNVVIPYLDNEAKALLKVANYVGAGYLETQLIDDPENFFGDNTRIIRVRAVGENGEANINTESPFLIDPEDNFARSIPQGATVSPNGQSVEIDSGTPIMSRLIASWLFVPFNYEQKERYRLFLTELAALGLAPADVDTIDKIQVQENKLIAAYKTVAGDLNKNSMFLYSGPTSESESDQGFHYFIQNNEPWFFPDFNVSHSGCLYTGDADLNEANLVSSLLAALSNYISYIATMVLPHHGAIKNHNLKLYEGLPDALFCMFSYGTTNYYGHPSDFVIADILTPHRLIVRVTENPYSIAVFIKP